MNIDDLNYMQKQIEAYRAGELTDEEIDLLWEKMIEDPDQLEYLINSVNLQVIASERKDILNPSGKAKYPNLKLLVFQRYRTTWGRIAAVVLILAGMLSTIYFFGSEYLYEQEPLAEIELDTYRSSTIPTAVFDYQVQRAINLASLEKYDQAIDMLNEIELAQLTDDQKVSLMLNKGSILYNRGDYRSAKDLFHEILDNHEDLHLLTEERVQWFLGNVYLQLGQEEIALEHIQKTYDLNGAYRRLAKRYLDQQ